MDATLHDHMMKSVKEIVVAWIAGRQIDFGSVSVELIGIVNSSIRLRVDDKIIQIVVPSTFQLHGCASSSTLLKGEVFLVTCVDCTSDELFGNTLQMLNERLERVTIEPDSLSNVLDCLLLALQKYQKAQAYMKEGSPSIQFERVNNLTEERVAQSHDVPDSNDDCSSTRVDDWDIEDDFCEFPAREDVESVAQIQDINAGFLYAMAEEAKLQCDLVREMVKTQKTFQNTSEQIISLQWCDVITDPKALTVYLLIHVGGIVHDDNLASAIGVSVNSPLKILLQFDKNIWMQKKKGLLRPLRGECKVTQDPQASLNDHNEESVEIGHTRGYGSRVLLPNLVHVYFRFLANDITSLEWASENKKLYEELHYFTSMENTFLGLLCFLSARIQTLQDWCPVCWSSLPYTICKLRTCDKELCLFTFEELGVGAPVLQEVQASPEIIDFEVSLAIAAARSCRDVFEPFPSFLLEKEEIRDRSASLHPNKNMDILHAVLSTIPPIETMQKCLNEVSLRVTLNNLWEKELDMEKHVNSREQPYSWLKLQSLPYSVLQYVLSTSRLKLHPLDASQRLPFFVSHYQFAVLHDTPEKEAYFKSQLQQKKGSIFAFHGSSADNWYSILRNGLRCLSNTHLMGSGATYGPGIYFSSQLQLSLRYSNQGSGWNHCILKNGFSVLAICEIINDSFRSQKEASSFSLSTHSGIVVVPPESEMDVAIRYIIVLRSIEENRGQVSIDRTVMSFDHVSVDRTVTSENIDLMKHYMALKLSYAEQQERQQKEHSIERFKSMCKFSEQLQEDDHGAVIAKKKRGYAVVEDSSQNSCLSTRSKKPVAACRAFSTSSLQAIAREYKYIVKQINEARESKPDIQDRDLLILTGVEVILPDETDICRWHVKLDQFLFKSFPIFKDLVSCAQHWGLPEVSIKLECIFSETYPFSPPFIRVVSPRFSLHTGHVTIGGSICMELLTRSGWSPANTFESVIVQVINAIIEGGGRLDKQAVLARSEYSEREAREAFNRVARDHGWS
ncbi:hypothetical protein KP509_11G052900 [Ceratopteris richardii]|uniref:UBC core domain-containing protein n=1 Tax=Ceratopteris richardii TaxID=49495 RepID=A0A8T2TVK6_CERRI|nr:hypothetical protein KP509_11G052900 [Ceratopteris richardii]